MIFEFQIKNFNDFSLKDLKTLRWVKKRRDLVSIFAFNNMERDKILKRLGKRFVYKEFLLNTFNECMPVNQNFIFDSFRFTGKDETGKDIISVNTTRSFGFDHPATILTLEMISLYKNSFQNQRVLDIGCGSGILSLYMLKKGGKKAFCVDIDPFIVDEARRNARVNGFSKKRLNVLLTDISKLKKSYQFIVANVPMNVHILIVDDVKRLLGLKGIFIAGGFFNSNFKELIELYKGLNLIELKTKEDWAAAAFENK